MTYVAFVITPLEKARIEKHITIPDGWTPILHHVTYQYPYKGLVDASSLAAFPDVKEIKIRSRHRNDKVDAYLVEVNDPRLGWTRLRPDGSTYHLTIAINPATGGKPVDANGLFVAASLNTFNDFSPELKNTIVGVQTEFCK